MDSFADLFKSLLALGPGGLVAAVFALLWRDERKERQETTARLLNQTGEVTKVMSAMTSAVEILTEKVSK